MRVPRSPRRSAVSGGPTSPAPPPRPAGFAGHRRCRSLNAVQQLGVLTAIGMVLTIARVLHPLPGARLPARRRARGELPRRRTRPAWRAGRRRRAATRARCASPCSRSPPWARSPRRACALDPTPASAAAGRLAGAARAGGARRALHALGAAAGRCWCGGRDIESALVDGERVGGALARLPRPRPDRAASRPSTRVLPSERTQRARLSGTTPLPRAAALASLDARAARPGLQAGALHGVRHQLRRAAHRRS